MYYITNQAGEVQFLDDYESAVREFDRRVHDAITSGREDVYSIVFGTCRGFVGQSSSGPCKVMVDATDIYKEVGFVGAKLLNQGVIVTYLCKIFAMQTFVNNLSQAEALRDVLSRFLVLVADEFSSEEFNAKEYVRDRLKTWGEIEFAARDEANREIEG